MGACNGEWELSDQACDGSCQHNEFTKLDPGRKKGKLAMGAFEAMNRAVQISDDFLSYLGAATLLPTVTWKFLQ
jgi:hypothetical protein